MNFFTRFRPVAVIAFALLLSIGAFAQPHSVAMQWNEVQINSIRKDFARPTVVARNLCHAAIVMWDAWAAYDDNAKPFLLGNTWGTYTCPFDGVPVPADIEAAREEAISFAMYRYLSNRYTTPLVPAANLTTIQGYRNAKMTELGYDINITSTDYSDGDPAKLGNYIAAKMQEYALQDGSNQQGNYANLYYLTVNGILFPEFPGNPYQVDANRWQPLCLNVNLDQNGNPVPCTGTALSPEFGNVNPFSWSAGQASVINHDGHDYKTYLDQGAPPYLDESSYDGLESFFKWGYVCNIIWHSFHDIADGVYMDISPNSIGNIQSYPAVGDFAAYQNFYDLYTGGETGDGYTVNPATGLPYEPQVVHRGDYTRVLSEFWADGPSSETPPGHWFTIINDKVTNHPGFEKKWMGAGPELNDLEWDVRSYLALGGGVMDAAIACWGAKGAYDYTRPISAIRYMAERGQCSDPLQANYNPAGLPLIPGYIEMVQPGDPLAGQNNENVDKVKVYSWTGPANETGTTGAGWLLGENWWTYQKNTFVTPPFPGYYSGHSTYSRTAAEILTDITGDPFFPGGLGDFTAPAFTYLGADVGPSEDIHLQWARYIDASDQCSLSRIYGGLHPPQDDIPGRTVGMVLGPQAVTKANEYIEATIPHIASVVTSDDLITDDDVDGTFTVAIHFTQTMNMSIAPTITYIDDNPATTLGQTSASWTNSTTYTINYNVSDANVELDEVVWKVSGAQSSTAQLMLPGLSNVVMVDTRNPLLASASGSDLLNDATAMAGTTTLTLVFDEDMDISANPSLSFPSEDPGASVSHNIGASSWLNSTTYSAVLNVTDQNFELNNIDVQVTSALDAAGNVQDLGLQADLFNIDTHNPSVSMTVNSDALITDGDAGSTFEVTLTYDEAMDMESTPAIDFSSDVSNTLAFDSGTWSDNMTYLATYNVTDANESISGIQIQSSSATDAAGNIQNNSVDASFAIDTENPVVVSVDVNDEVIADANAGNGGFTVTLHFDGAMDTDVDPIITFPDGTLSNLDYNASLSGWTNDQTFVGAFDVTDGNEEIWNITVEATGTSDQAGNGQTSDFSAANVFSMDTRNPELVLLSANEYNITSNDVGATGFVLIAVFDEAMETEGECTVTFPVEDPSATLTLNVNSCAWLNELTYESVFSVGTDVTSLLDIDVDVAGAMDAAGNDAVVFNASDYFDINAVVSTQEIASSELAVFPNPVSIGSALTVSWTGLKPGTQVRLIDGLGQVVLDEVVNTTGGLFVLNTSKLAAGTYNLILNQNDAQFVKIVQVVK